MTLDHEVEVLEHQFARNSVETVARRGPLPRSAHRSRSTDRERRARDCHAPTASCIAVGTAPVPARRTSPFDGETHLRQRRDPRPDAHAAQPDRGRRRRHRRRIRHDLLGARRAGDAGRAAPSHARRSSTASWSTSSSTICATAACTLRFGAKVERVARRRRRGLPSSSSTTAASSRADMVLFAAGRDGATDDLGPRRLRPRRRRARPPQRRQGHLPDRRAAHLCRRRRHRLPEPRLDLDGAGPHRRLPRLRRAGATRRRSSSPTASIRCRRSRPSA